MRLRVKLAMYIPDIPPSRFFGMQLYEERRESILLCTFTFMGNKAVSSDYRTTLRFLSQLLMCYE